MRIRNVIILVLFLFALATALLQAETFPLDWQSARLFEEIVSQARDKAPLKEVAFRFLKIVAEGRKDEISRELVADFRSRGNFFHPQQLAEIGVRARAYEQIGRLATPEALAYLESIDLTQFTTVEEQPFARSIPFGIFLAKAGQMEDAQRRWEFYAETLRHPPAGLGRDGPLAAAYSGLCTEGALGFLPDIEMHIRRGRARKEQEDRIQSCRQMMHMVASHSSRVAGLEAALYVDTNVYGKYFRAWAIQVLAEMHTQESRTALEKFIATAKTWPGARYGDFQRQPGVTEGDPQLRNDIRSAELALIRRTP
jgi:hypothetical protein